ncbi:hypothetical protein C7437_102256 [Psychrobacillus insolitus]|jgi:ribosomal protein L29|uniref:Uncharacterized protein n=1 Tax=Psychrobacillus insolitus TaxID=1461 RepID=A0A2W7MRH4_9BACI|nr:SE1832 family protein [Psychrobacillus insolitus]PZX05792.1 hypothetical protein C7437_102256 [Psychrobacillus insolitus]
MTKQQLQAQIAELKMDYINLQGDMEKLESNGHPTQLENAERRLAKMEDNLAELNKQLSEL